MTSFKYGQLLALVPEPEERLWSAKFPPKPAAGLLLAGGPGSSAAHWSAGPSLLPPPQHPFSPLQDSWVRPWSYSPLSSGLPAELDYTPNNPACLLDLEQELGMAKFLMTFYIFTPQTHSLGCRTEAWLSWESDLAFIWFDNLTVSSYGDYEKNFLENGTCLLWRAGPIHRKLDGVGPFDNRPSTN